MQGKWEFKVEAKKNMITGSIETKLFVIYAIGDDREIYAIKNGKLKLIKTMTPAEVEEGLSPQYVFFSVCLNEGNKEFYEGLADAIKKATGKIDYNNVNQPADELLFPSASVDDLRDILQSYIRLADLFTDLCETQQSYIKQLEKENR